MKGGLKPIKGEAEVNKDRRIFPWMGGGGGWVLKPPWLRHCLLAFRINSFTVAERFLISDLKFDPKFKTRSKPSQLRLNDENLKCHTLVCSCLLLLRKI